MGMRLTYSKESGASVNDAVRAPIHTPPVSPACDQPIARCEIFLCYGNAIIGGDLTARRRKYELGKWIQSPTASARQAPRETADVPVGVNMMDEKGRSAFGDLNRPRADIEHAHGLRLRSAAWGGIGTWVQVGREPCKRACAWVGARFPAFNVQHVLRAPWRMLTSRNMIVYDSPGHNLDILCTHVQYLLRKTVCVRRSTIGPELAAKKDQGREVTRLEERVNVRQATTGGRQIESGAPKVAGAPLAGYWAAVPSLLTSGEAISELHAASSMHHRSDARATGLENNPLDRRQTSAAGNGALEFSQYKGFTVCSMPGLVQARARITTTQTTRELEYLIGSYTTSIKGTAD
ncbi:hypothetical protein BJY52DRAFT_1223346 [Lactarius psammicola]|nr:hypothetical protein BJY52DRAFT_1223346 [Lactarius psammicola]